MGAAEKLSICRRGLLVAGAALLGAGPAGAAAQDWRPRVLQILEARKVPAAGVVLVKDGRTLIAEGFGLASVPFSVPATARSLFHLGSVSKQFTAATVLQLADEGLISLDDPVGRHARGLPETLADRPVRALLSHTSGVADYEGLPGFASDRPIDRPAFVKAAAQLAPEFRPGEAWAYSNTGYVLLGYLIADVTGVSYHEAVRARLLAPAGLQEARFDAARDIIPGRAEPYVLEDGELRHATQMDSDYSGWPDGGLLMSARDGARWEAGLQAGRPIGPAMLSRMTTPVRLSSGRSAGYGYAWFTDRVNGRSIHYHTGAVDGFICFYLRSPADRAGALVMVNVEGALGGRAMRDIGQELMEMAAPGSTPVGLPALRDDAPALTSQARDILLRKGAPLDPDLFAPEMARHLGIATVAPPDRGALGPARISLVEAFDEPGGHVRRYRLAFADRIEHVAFAHRPDGRIFRVRAI